MTEIVQAISTVGFPITMCIIMMYYMQKNNESHKEEVDTLKDAINNNTLVMTQVLDKLGME